MGSMLFVLRYTLDVNSRKGNSSLNIIVFKCIWAIVGIGKFYLSMQYQLKP